MALYGNIPLLLAHGKVGKTGAQKSMTAVSVCVHVCACVVCTCGLIVDRLGFK